MKTIPFCAPPLLLTRAPGGGGEAQNPKIRAPGGPPPKGRWPCAQPCPHPREGPQNTKTRPPGVFSGRGKKGGERAPPGGRRERARARGWAPFLAPGWGAPAPGGPKNPRGKRAPPFSSDPRGMGPKTKSAPKRPLGKKPRGSAPPGGIGPEGRGFFFFIKTPGPLKPPYPRAPEKCFSPSGPQTPIFFGKGRGSHTPSVLAKSRCRGGF